MAAELTRRGRTHEFRRCDGADRAFFARLRLNYRIEQAVAGRPKALGFFAENLSK